MAETAAPVEKPEKNKAAVDRFIWLIYNEERRRILACAGTANLVSKIPQPGPQIVLIPGANVIDMRSWNQWKKENADRTVDGETVAGQATMLLKGQIPSDPHKNRRAEKAGKPYIVEGPTIADAKTPLAKLDEMKALEMAGEILDEEMLKRMIQIERRSVVIARLERQLTEHKNANRPAA